MWSWYCVGMYSSGLQLTVCVHIDGSPIFHVCTLHPMWCMCAIKTVALEINELRRGLNSTASLLSHSALHCRQPEVERGINTSIRSICECINCALQLWALVWRERERGPESRPEETQLIQMLFKKTAQEQMSLQNSAQVCSSGSLSDVLIFLKSFLLPWIL